MNNLFRITLITLLLATPALAQKVEPPAPQPGLEFFSAGDVTMNAAIAEAQRTLPLFLDHVTGADGQIHEGSVKVAFQTFPTDQGVEIIWVSPLSRNADGTFQGRLNNQPFHLGDWQRGDLVTFPESAIEDWSLPSPSGRYGNYTTRVIAAQPGNGHLFDSLAPSPLPPEWE